jgi:hypothetical protein
MGVQAFDTLWKTSSRRQATASNGCENGLEQKDRQRHCCRFARLPPSLAEALRYIRGDGASGPVEQLSNKRASVQRPFCSGWPLFPHRTGSIVRCARRPCAGMAHECPGWCVPVQPPTGTRPRMTRCASRPSPAPTSKLPRPRSARPCAARGWTAPRPPCRAGSTCRPHPLPPGDPPPPLSSANHRSPGPRPAHSRAPLLRTARSPFNWSASWPPRFSSASARSPNSITPA